MGIIIGSNRGVADGVVLAVHGGAGHLSVKHIPAELDAQCRAGLRTALERGYAVWKAGGSALDIAEVAVTTLEDDPRFNAGRGAVFNAAGQIELDAAIMDGSTLRAGAVAGVNRVKNPVSLARAIAERSPHVFLIGDGAQVYAQQIGAALVEPEYFHTSERWDQLLRARAAGDISLSEDNKFGTVGAVARCRQNHLSSATSTGGMTNKRYGRVGDTPIIGAGTWAQDGACAVSSTGHGEFFLRLGVAHEIAARMRLLGESLDVAANHLIHEALFALAGEAGTGGLIALDASGRAALPFNTSGMYRGVVTESGEVVVAIYEE
jgi:beta-aspartyl-peptidase (threonine type)